MIKIFINKITLAVILLVVCNMLAQERSNVSVCGQGWSTSHADGGNTDYSPVIGPRNIKLAWHYKFEGTINLGPTSDEQGRVYVTTTAEGCHLYVFDYKTGNLIWCSDEVNKYAVASSALLDNEGRTFIADNEAMHAFDHTGELLWETPILGLPFSAQFTQTGHIIFITHIGRIYVLDRKTGKNILEPVDLISDQLQNAKVNVRACMKGTEDCPCANTLAFDKHTGNFYFTFWAPGSQQAALRAMQYSEDPIPSIKLLWVNDSLQEGSASSPVLSFDGKRVYVNDNGGILHSIDAETGETIWQFNIGYETGGSQSISPEGLIMPAGGRNTPLICIKDQGSYAELLWQNNKLQNRGIATQSGGGLAYITAKTERFENDIVVVETSSGSEIDREHLPGTTIFTVGTTISLDGYIFVPSINGYLFAFCPE